MAAQPEQYWLRVGGRDFTCLACRQGTRFYWREIRMNTAGMTLMGLDWLNRAADGAICELCGYVHSFFGDSVQWARQQRRTEPRGRARQRRRFGGGD